MCSIPLTTWATKYLSRLTLVAKSCFSKGRGFKTPALSFCLFNSKNKRIQGLNIWHNFIRMLIFSMARPLRLSFENAFHHITARGNRREKIFYKLGLVKQLEDYPWSSYLDYLYLRRSNISNLDPSFVLHLLSVNLFESMEKYRGYIIQHQDIKDPL